MPGMGRGCVKAPAADFAYVNFSHAGAISREFSCPSRPLAHLHSARPEFSHNLGRNLTLDAPGNAGSFGEPLHTVPAVSVCVRVRSPLYG